MQTLLETATGNLIRAAYRPVRDTADIIAVYRELETVIPLIDAAKAEIEIRLHYEGGI